jgi:hypothetical protein
LLVLLGGGRDARAQQKERPADAGVQTTRSGIPLEAALAKARALRDRARALQRENAATAARVRRTTDAHLVGNDRAAHPGTHPSGSAGTGADPGATPLGLVSAAESLLTDSCKRPSSYDGWGCGLLSANLDTALDNLEICLECEAGIHKELGSLHEAVLDAVQQRTMSSTDGDEVRRAIEAALKRSAESQACIDKFFADVEELVAQGPRCPRPRMKMPTPDPRE